MGNFLGDDEVTRVKRSVGLQKYSENTMDEARNINRSIIRK